MRIIKEIIIVEGKHDESFLKTFLDAQIITTSGTSLPPSTLLLIEELKKNGNSFIILTDPDYPGSYIRNELLKIIPDAKIANIRKGKTRVEGTIGVENATKEEILNALDNLISYVDYKPTLDQQDLFSLKLIGDDNSSYRREKICNALSLGLCNGKSFLKKINMLELNKQDLIKKIKEILDER